MIAEGRIAIGGEKSNSGDLARLAPRRDRRWPPGPAGRRRPASTASTSPRAAHRRARPEGPADDLRPAPAGPAAGDAGRPARFHDRGPAAPDQRRRAEAPARAAGTGVERTYRARAFGDVSQEQLEGLAEGIEIEGMRYGSIDANLERRTGRNCWIEMSLTEGKNREVRRVLDISASRCRG